MARPGVWCALAASCHEAWSRKWERVLLLEVRANDKDLALYRHFGFQQIGVRRGYYPANGGREDALVLTHALSEMSA